MEGFSVVTARGLGRGQGRTAELGRSSGDGTAARGGRSLRVGDAQVWPLIV